MVKPLELVVFARKGPAAISYHGEKRNGGRRKIGAGAVESRRGWRTRCAGSETFGEAGQSVCDCCGWGGGGGYRVVVERRERREERGEPGSPLKRDKEGEEV